MDDFRQIKHNFLKEAFVPWLTDTFHLDISDLEIEAERFAKMSMRILQHEAPEPIDTMRDATDKEQAEHDKQDGFESEEIPLNAYENEIPPH